ncbi:MAG: CsgG/HfaB family protein [Myxococcota bacterium]
MMRAVLVALLATFLCSATSGPPVLAVLYFDNNTGNPELDPLRKGLADMMITDLSSAVTVVEREKLQALLDELKLQRTEFFAPETAQQLGKGVGATHVVTGAFLAADPQLRVDIRLVEVGTGKVVLADKVVGERGKLFDLQQVLVQRFLVGMDLKMKGAVPRTRADYATAVEYGRSLDLVDQGRLDDAAKAMQAVVKRAPAFGLARQRHEEILRRLAEAQAKRTALLAHAAETLASHAQQFITTHRFEELRPDEARTFLAYRYYLGVDLLRRLVPHLTTGWPTCIRPGHETDAHRLTDEFLTNARTLTRELRRYEEKHTQTHPNGQRFLDTSFRLPHDDDERVRQAGYNSVPDVLGLQLLAPQFSLLGTAHLGDAFRLALAPTPASRSEQERERALQELKDLVSVEDQRTTSAAHSAVRVREVLADAYLRLDRPDDAVAVWQETLDRHPGAAAFSRLQERIRQESGLAHHPQRGDLLAYPSSLAACDDMGLRKGFDQVIPHRMYSLGVGALPATVDEITSRCTTNRSLTQYVFAHGALVAAAHGECAWFEQYMARFLEAGGSRSDVDGYRRNYAKACHQ